MLRFRIIRREIEMGRFWQFWQFQQGILGVKVVGEVMHDVISMFWIPSALDLNKASQDYLYLTIVGHTI